MNAVLKGYLQLMRPANLPTAAADVLAGIAIGGAVSQSDPWVLEASFQALLFLVLSSMCLYAGGVVLNDYFDAGIDALERPERPIPSGLISKKNVLIFGLTWLVLGVMFATAVHTTATIIALCLVFGILSYDGLMKRWAIPGSLNMGLCRGLNLLLGISILGDFSHAALAIIPVLYIFAITWISRGEVGGNNRQAILLAAALYVCVILSVLYVANAQGRLGWEMLIFMALFAISIGYPLLRAYRVNTAQHVRSAVVAGILSIVLLDSCWAILFGHFSFAFFVLLLLPFSAGLGRLFKVT